MSVIRDIQDCLFWRKEKKARQQIQEAAFADGRFVMNLHIRNRMTLVSFTPHEEEALWFFRTCLVPVCIEQKGGFLNNNWYGLKGGPVSQRPPYLETVLFRDVARVEILTPNVAYRDRLEVIFRQAVREEADRANVADAEKKALVVGAQGQFRKKPVVIDAWQISTNLSPPPGWIVDALACWPSVGGLKWELDYPDGPRIAIATLEGVMTGRVGKGAPHDPSDWIIRGVKGELYGCKPDIFDLTYDSVL